MSPRIPPLRRAGVGVSALLLVPALLAAQQNPPVTKGEVAPAPAVLNAGSLAKLRWIAGTWRGAGADAAAFYERYRFVDDSTLEVDSFADSTLARVTETARYELRAGRLANVGTGPRWAAVRLDDSVASFAPRERVYRLTRISPRR